MTINTNSYKFVQGNTYSRIKLALSIVFIAVVIFFILKKDFRIHNYVVVIILIYFVISEQKDAWINRNYSFRFDEDGSFYINKKYFCHYDDTLVFVVRAEDIQNEHLTYVDAYFKHGYGKDSKKNKIANKVRKEKIIGLIKFLKDNYPQVDIQFLDDWQLD